VKNLIIVTLCRHGEDYELLFTIAMEDFEKIKANPNFSIIGHMTRKANSF
jgi:thiamine monophosphate kinase